MSHMKPKFEKRRSTLMRKARELQTLCDVGVCMVCFAPGGEDVVTWPENKAEVYQIINNYKLQKLLETSKEKVPKHRYNVDLLGFLSSKKQKLQKLKNEKTIKENKDVIENLVSSWETKLIESSEESLVALCNGLDSKLQTLRDKIKLLEKEKASDQQVNHNGRNMDHNNNTLNVEESSRHQHELAFDPTVLRQSEFFLDAESNSSSCDFLFRETKVDPLDNFRSSFPLGFGYENFDNFMRDE